MKVQAKNVVRLFTMTAKHDCQSHNGNGPLTYMQICPRGGWKIENLFGELFTII